MPVAAFREDGVCRGSLWKQHCSSVSQGVPSGGFGTTTFCNERSKYHEYCVLIGNTLTSYADLSSYRRGDFPSTEIRIVGASSWNPRRFGAARTPSFEGNSPTFRIVTYAGTHVYCTAPSLSDRDTWLSALHSGLEASYTGLDHFHLQQQQVHKEQELSNKNDTHSNFSSPNDKKSKIAVVAAPDTEIFLPPQQPNYARYCKGCGITPPPPTKPPLAFHSFACPLPHYNAELRVDYLCNNCLIAQGLYFSVREMNGLYSGMIHERAAMKAARELCLSSVTKTVNELQGEWYSHSRYLDSTSNSNAVDDQTPERERHSIILSGPASNNLSGSWEAITGKHNNLDQSSSSTTSWHCINSSIEQTVTSALIQLISTPGFATLRRRSRCLDYECAKLETGNLSGAAEYLENLDAMCGLHDEDDGVHLLSDNSNGVCAVPEKKLEMKKEALKLSGDLSAAIKCLHNAALGISSPSYPGSGTTSHSHSANSKADSSTNSTSNGGAEGFEVGSCHQLNNLDMQTCLLELFLDLCEEGEISAIAFFWPQLTHIYLSMLPPTNVTELCRIELMEDFLLTVATKHSPQLALGLFWGCLADLEEGLGPLLSSRNYSPSNTSGADQEEDTSENLPPEVADKIRFRRWYVLRFVCELESLIFGFDGGWGGGSVCLRGALTPSEHQSMLIRDAIKTLQTFRVQSNNFLTRSVRRDAVLLDSSGRPRADSNNNTYSRFGIPTYNRDKIVEGNNNKLTPQRSVFLDPAVSQRNANYISSQLIFVRKLGDIAEKLRFLPVYRREHALVSELRKLNLYLGEGYKSGKLYAAGDPMAAITSLQDDLVGDESVTHQRSGLAKVVHLPIHEGHVFRSKARTPVLLLMETLHERSDSLISPSAQQTNLSNHDSHQLSSTTPSSSTASENEEEEGKNHEDSHPPNDRRCPTPTSKTNSQRVLLRSIARLNSPSRDRNSSIIFTEGELPMLPQFSPSSPYVDERNPSISGSESSGRSRLDSGANQSDCTVDDVSELVQNAIHEKLTIDDHKLKLPKLEELGGASDPVATAALASGGKYDTNRRDNEPGVAEEYKMEHVEDADFITDDATSPTDPSESQESSTCLKPGGSSTRIPNRYSSLTRNVSRRMTALGAQSHRAVNRFQSSRTLRGPSWYATDRNPKSAHPPLAELGSERREVLATILASSMKGNIIAKGAAAAAQRAIQTIDRKLALDMIRSSTDAEDHTSAKISVCEPLKAVPQTDLAGANTNSRSESQTEVYFPSSNDPDVNTTSFGRKDPNSLEEDDECMESLRLVLLQNRVAQGNLTPEGAARALIGSEGRLRNNLLSHFKGKDAGELDPRLAGCGPLSHAVHSALQLWKEGTISNGELLELARRDSQFLRQTALPGSENISNLMEDSAFWVRFSFGERWAEKKARIAARSPYGSQEGWDLVSVIIKSNDDLRQEAFVMQLIQLCKEAFALAGLELWLHPYKIVSTGKSTGMIELLKNTLSFDSLKKRPGYTGLRGHFERMTEYAANPQEAFQLAQTNFVRSLAAYSLLSYLFLFKDRHNGNLLLDTEGHVIHIDFGFVFGIAPGGSFSLESATPFKLTEEMIEVVGGLNSSLFSDFVTLFCCGLLALKQHADTFCTLVDITCRNSALPCFAGKDPKEIVEKLRGRFCTHMDKSSTIAYSLDLIKQSLTSYGTRQYDFFQYLSNGVAT